MKRSILLVFVLVLLVASLPALAQQDNPNLITLNDAAPAIDVVISLPPDTTGTIALDLAQASVTLTDANNTVVFYAADARLHGVEFNIAPNSGSHTLTVERLPGVTEAYVSVVSLPEMTINGDVALIDGTTLTLNEETSLPLTTDNPGGTVQVSIPEATTGALTATFPGAGAMSQLVDNVGIVLAESQGGHVDGLTYVLDAGDYQFTILGSDMLNTVIAGVRAVSAEAGGFAVIDAPQPASPQAVTAPVTDACTATITASSVNLRSGPGTGYSVLGYAYRGESFQVGGQNPENNWIVVGLADGSSAWLSQGVAQAQGNCSALTVFNIPLRDAAPAQITITTPGSATSGSYDDDDHYEYEDDHDDDHGEWEDDDD